MEAWLSNLAMIFVPILAFGSLAAIVGLLKVFPDVAEWYSELSMPVNGNFFSSFVLIFHLLMEAGAILGLAMIADNLMEIFLRNGTFSYIGIVVYVVSTILSVFSVLFATEVLDDNSVIFDEEPYRKTFAWLLLFPAGIFNAFSFVVYLPLTVKYFGEKFLYSVEKNKSKKERQIELETQNINKDGVVVLHLGIKISKKSFASVESFEE